MYSPTPSETALVTQARKTLKPHLPHHALLDEDAPFGTLAAPSGYDGKNHAHFLDLTNLKPQATTTDIKTLCTQAKKINAAAVCVNPFYIKLVADLLQGVPTLPICVVGFPLGATLPESLTAEIQMVMEAGAQEVDMVMNGGLLKEKKFIELYNMINTATQTAGQVPVKVILETCTLTDEEIVLASLIAATAGAGFVKTSTGFALSKQERAPHTGATPQAVRLMRLAVGDEVGVKASGGIKTPQDARILLENGANRLGASGLSESAY